MLLPDYAECNVYSLRWQNELRNYERSGASLRKPLPTMQACIGSRLVGLSKGDGYPHSKRF